MANVTATWHPFSEHPRADSCWSLHGGPDGRVYAAACCEHTGGETATVVRYDAAADRLETLFALDEATGDLRDSGRATQCKIHYSFAPDPATGLLYAATHLSGPPVGETDYDPWLGWHDARRGFRGAYLVAFDTARDTVVSADLMIPKEGCRCLCLDPERRRLYAITYPRDHFVIRDLERGTLRDLGRIGTINSQILFGDRRGRIHFTDDRGRFRRYDPDRDALETLPHVYPHASYQSGWHGVLYDAVADPSGEAVYMVPWMVAPRLARFRPEDGPDGRLEDLGPLTQPRDPKQLHSMWLDHVGGLVFGRDGCLYCVRSVWPAGAGGALSDAHPGAAARGVVTRYRPDTGQMEDVATLERPDGRPANYVSRGARDAEGNLYFGHVGVPTVGLFRVTAPDGVAAPSPPPLRLWG